jgi:hypothetical protein
MCHITYYVILSDFDLRYLTSFTSPRTAYLVLLVLATYPLYYLLTGKSIVRQYLNVVGR